MPNDLAASWLETIGKVGLGVASFGGLLFVLRWFTVELRDSRLAFAVELKDTRGAFLASLDKQHAEHAAENHLLAEKQDRQTARILDRIDGLECAPASRDRNNSGGSNR